MRAFTEEIDVLFRQHGVWLSKWHACRIKQPSIAGRLRVSKAERRSLSRPAIEGLFDTHPLR
jgi:hypothetical protein